jgi:hypothetical protein
MRPWRDWDLGTTGGSERSTRLQFVDPILGKKVLDTRDKEGSESGMVVSLAK